MLQQRKKSWLVLVFALLTLATGIRLALTTPMGQVPDEPAHIVRAAALTHAELLGTHKRFGSDLTAGLYVNEGIGIASTAEINRRGEGRLTEAQRHFARNIPWSGERMFAVCRNTIEYLPVFYIPGSLGIGIGRLAGLPPLAALYLGRIFMLGAFLVLGAAALWLARLGAGVLFVALSLPMTLSLAASLSQDGPIIGASALAGALLTRDDARHPRSKWIAAAIIGLICCAKPPYGMLLFCAALPIGLVGTIRRTLTAGLFGLPAAAWVAIMMTTSFVPPHRPPYHPGALWPGDPDAVFRTINGLANLRVLAHAPSLVLRLPYHTLATGFPTYRAEFIGVLGWLDVRLPHSLYVGWTIALLAALTGACLAAEPDARRWRPADATVVIVVLIVTVIAICLSLYLSWTRVGGTMIQGIQGRYFIPLLPFVVLALPRLVRVGEDRRRIVRSAAVIEIVSILPAIGLAAVGVDRLPALIRAAFG